MSFYGTFGKQIGFLQISQYYFYLFHSLLVYNLKCLKLPLHCKCLTNFAIKFIVERWVFFVIMISCYIFDVQGLTNQVPLESYFFITNLLETRRLSSDQNYPSNLEKQLKTVKHWSVKPFKFKLVCEKKIQKSNSIKYTQIILPGWGSKPLNSLCSFMYLLTS